MNLNRRTFLLTASALTGMRPLVSRAAQRNVISGGIGLTLAEVRSLYPELDAGQGFRSFAEEETRSALYIDFGQENFAQNIWVDGSLDEDTALELAAWLCPDDAVPTNLYEVLTGAGSIAIEKSIVFNSRLLANYDPDRQNIMVKYVVLPGEPRVENLMLTLEQAIGSRR